MPFASRGSSASRRARRILMVPRVPSSRCAHVPDGCPREGRGGRGEVSRAAEGILPVPVDLRAQESAAGDRRVRPAAPDGERLRRARDCDGRRSARCLRRTEGEREETDPPHVPALRRPARRSARRPGRESTTSPIPPTTQRKHPAPPPPPSPPPAPARSPPTTEREREDPPPPRARAKKGRAPASTR